MPQPITRADWLSIQSQQHFQKLAHLSVRTEGAQRMGRIAARQKVASRRISSIGGISKVALSGLLIQGAKAGLRAGKAATTASKATKAVGAVGKALPKPPTAVMNAKAPTFLGKATPKTPTPAQPAVTPAAGGGASRAATPTVSAPSPVKGTPTVVSRSTPTVAAKAPVSGGGAKTVADPKARLTPDQARLVEAGVSPERARGLSGMRSTDEIYGGTPQAMKGGASPRRSYDWSSKRWSDSPTAPAPSPIRGTQGTQAAIPSKVTPQAGSSVGQVTPAPATATGRVAQLPPQPQAPVGRLQGAYRSPGGAPPPPIPPPTPVTPPGGAAKPPDLSLIDDIAPAPKAKGPLDKGPAELTGPKAQPSAVDDAAAAAAPADAAQGWWGGLPAAARWLPAAGLVGGGLAIGGTALGAGQALQQSGAPYRYGAGAPFPGRRAYM